MRSWLMPRMRGEGWTGLQFRQKGEPLGADILELEGDDIDAHRRSARSASGSS